MVHHEGRSYGGSWQIPRVELSRTERCWSQGSVEKVLEAKYAYAEFLGNEAERSRDPELLQQARKLCSDVMIDDIDYRNIRQLATRIDELANRTK